jgi:hypothetical protein
MALGKKTGGRKKGTPNKKTSSVQEKLDRLGCDPIEGMAIIANRAMAEGDLPLAGSMYKELAQYVAPKRKTVELSNEEGSGPLRIEWKS